MLRGRGAVLLGWLSAMAPGCSRDLRPITLRPEQTDQQCPGRDAGASGDSRREGGPTSGPCHSRGDCPGDTVCLYETGQCAARSAAVCTPMPSSGGAAKAHSGCGATSDCDKDLVCVFLTLAMNESTGIYEPDKETFSAPPGRCVLACNPCTGSCPTGICVGLQAGGGFCAPRPLAGEGAPCATNRIPLAWCEAGTTCLLSALGQDGQCSKHCTPDPQASWKSDTFSSTASRDCSAGEVCTRHSDSVSHSFWFCEKAELVGTGQGCRNPLHPASRCTWPDTCSNSSSLAGAPGTCSEGCNCSTGVPCRFTAHPNAKPACVAPGSVGVTGLCEQTVDCEPPAVCTPGTGGTLQCLPI